MSSRVRASYMFSTATCHDGTKGPSIPRSSLNHPCSTILIHLSDYMFDLVYCLMNSFLHRVHFSNMDLESGLAMMELSRLPIHPSIDIIHFVSLGMF